MGRPMFRASETPGQMKRDRCQRPNSRYVSHQLGSTAFPGPLYNSLHGYQQPARPLLRCAEAGTIWRTARLAATTPRRISRRPPESRAAVAPLPYLSSQQRRADCVCGGTRITDAERRVAVPVVRETVVHTSPRSTGGAGMRRSTQLPRSCVRLPLGCAWSSARESSSARRVRTGSASMTMPLRS
jgi:hypothetical protein